MGCCLGTTSNRRQTDNSKLTSEPTPTPHSVPPPFEEETVKEVLSETPIVPKTLTPPVIVERCDIIRPEESKTESESGGVGLGLTEKPTDEIRENVSEMSEMYTFSESFSAATTATVSVADKKEEIEMDDDGEVTQKVKNRSAPAKRVTRKRPVVSSGELSVRKERVVRPPVKKQMVPSPEKKRQSPSRTNANAQRHRNVGQSNDGRREVTGRRSRSPAVRGEAGQPRKLREKSPVEKPSEVIPVTAGKREERSAVEKADDCGVSPELQTNESLENPLVSLECFIFL